MVRVMGHGEEEAAELTRIRKLLDSAPDAMVIVGPGGTIELVNIQTETMFGYPRHELVGAQLEILIPARFRQGHQGHMARYLAHPGTRPMGSGLELYGRRRDGREFPIEVSLSPLDDHRMTVSAAIRDVSDRIELAATARRTADRLRSAVDSIEAAFALFDAEDRLILCNHVFQTLVAHELGASIVGRRYVEILDAWMPAIAFPDDKARDDFRRERLVQRSAPISSTDVHMRDGRTLRVADRRTAEGGIVKTVWDVTDDERRAAELRDARATAEAANAAKSDFLSSMSHELRTPLNAILGFAHLLVRDRREPLSVRHAERAEHIIRGGEHLLRLINDILDLSKIEAGHVSLFVEPVNIATVLAELPRTLEPIAARHGITLLVEPAAAVLPLIDADRTRFVQILMNFGSNAIKYNRPGGSVTFVAERCSSTMIRITVRDTGVGVPVSQQAQLFQPFQRAGQETGSIEGTGIGLTITKRLAELMSGSVGFSSIPGRGSEFWVDLPASDAAPSLVAAPCITAARHLVLYIEDNYPSIELVRDLLSGFESVELVAVPTGDLGIELARARQPAIVMMNVDLPGTSGVELLARLAADPATSAIPVIALTGAASPRDREQGLAAGFYRYLVKPLDVDEVIGAIDAAFALAPTCQDGADAAHVR